MSHSRTAALVTIAAIVSFVAGVSASALGASSSPSVATSQGTANDLSGPLAAFAPAAKFPPAGSDWILASASLSYQAPCGSATHTAYLAGTATIRRSAVVLVGTHRSIQTSLTNLDLTGSGPAIGAFTLALSPVYASRGLTSSLNPTTSASDFPADSYFDVFFQILGSGFTMMNPHGAPMRIESKVTLGVPAMGSDFAYAGAPIGLLDSNGNPTGVCVTGANLVPESASVALLEDQLQQIYQKLNTIAPN